MTNKKRSASARIFDSNESSGTPCICGFFRDETRHDEDQGVNLKAVARHRVYVRRHQKQFRLIKSPGDRKADELTSHQLDCRTRYICTYIGCIYRTQPRPTRYYCLSRLSREGVARISRQGYARASGGFYYVGAKAARINRVEISASTAN